MKAKTRKTLLIVCIALAAFAAVYTILALLPRPQNYKSTNRMMKESELPMLIAHGGGNKEFPDNTLEAFYNAYHVNKKAMMETDVSITKDGVLLLSHDVTLDRKTDVTGAIADWNYTDLMEQEVNFNYENATENGVRKGDLVQYKTDGGKGVTVTPRDVSYPAGVSRRHNSKFLATTLEQLLVAFPDNKINVEIKQSGETGKLALKEAVRLLDKYNAWGRVVLASFHNEIFKEYKAMQRKGSADEKFMYSPGTAGAATFAVLQKIGLDVFYGTGVCVLQLPMSQIGINLAYKAFVDSAHKHNIAVHYWTIDNEDDMRYLINIGADGIMTNYPNRLQNVYDDIALNG